MSFPDIHYLRWVRTKALAEGTTLPLILSGMGAPSADFLKDLDPASLLAAEPGDQGALARRIAADWGLATESVLVQPGSHWNLYLAVAARLDRNPGPVIVEEPCYEPLRRIPAALGAQVIRLHRSAAEGYAFDPKALRKLARQNPSLLLISHPHNPSGAELVEDEVEALAAFAAETGCAILSDEVYLEFLPDPDAASLRGRIEGTMVVRSFTKVMGLGSIRCSILAGPADWIAAAAAITDYGPVLLPAPTAAVAALAWERRDELWERARKTAARGRARVADWAQGLSELLQVELPAHGVVCVPRPLPSVAAALALKARRQGVEGPFGFGLDTFPGGSHEWIEAARRQKGVLVTPGGFFESPLGFRVGFGGPEEILEAGLSAIAEYLTEDLA